MSATDQITILTTTGRDRQKMATKQITRHADQWQIADYDNAKWWSVRQIEVRDIVSLGRALKSIETDPHSCAIRGEPYAGVNLSCCRRLKDKDPKDGTLPSFEAWARYWLGVDADSVAAPIWDADLLARRRAAIHRDRKEHPVIMPKGEDDGEDADIDGDDDPAPIDPVRDWAHALRGVIITLPPEFHDASVWWSMTSSAGIKPGIRLRLWYWLDRPVSDEEAKRWLRRSPVDHSLYGAVGIHYTAAPIFDPPGLDPVPLRSGFWWRHSNAVAVPDLRVPVTPKAATGHQRRFTGEASAERYAQACIDSVVSAPSGTGEARRRLLGVARTLYGMAEKGLINQAEVTASLKDAMTNRGWTQQGRAFSADEVERHLAWAKDRADQTLPDGFR
jgi:hypothetical protein